MLSDNPNKLLGLYFFILTGSLRELQSIPEAELLFENQSCLFPSLLIQVPVHSLYSSFS